MSEQKTHVSEYSPLELITYLFSHLQLADNQIDWEEKEVWAESLIKFFPDHPPERAQDIASYAGPAGNADTGDQREVVEIGANWTGKMGGTSVGVSGSWGEASEEVSSDAGDDREEYTLGILPI